MLQRRAAFISSITIIILFAVFNAAFSVDPPDPKKTTAKTPATPSTYLAPPATRASGEHFPPSSRTKLPQDADATPRRCVRVFIVGAAGYIGSALQASLAQEGYCVSGVDRNLRASQLNVPRMQASDVSLSTLREQNVIIYLGGLTGRVVCESGGIDECTRQNVNDVIRFVRQLSKGQLFLVASTSAITEGSGAGPEATESFRGKPENMDAYSLSMLRREERLEKLAKDPQYVGPTIVSMRFGTVIGVSPSQRSNYAHIAMLKSALTVGHIGVTQPETKRSFLWLNDLSMYISKLIAARERLAETPHHIFHLLSFNSNIMQSANEVARVTGISVAARTPVASDPPGFHMSGSKLAHFINATARGTPRVVMQDLYANIDHVLVGREILDDSIQGQCRVCGEKRMMKVLDLGMQPLANDFRYSASEAADCPRFPLVLERCRRCNHAQLHDIGPERKTLFSNYSYRSGTSRTLSDYFSWLAQKVTAESSAVGERQVLEIASNDGTQLDHFKALGWKTHGVDPAANLVALAKPKGHNVIAAFWGDPSHADRLANLPPTFDAIVAQNVFAHVPSPVSFLEGCRDRMHAHSKLYIQTSQCDMFADGQFDTIYHEHISFFSPQSFLAAAKRVGLRIIAWNITYIHGGSCLLTMVRDSAEFVEDGTFERALDRTAKLGQLQDGYYIRYRGRVDSTTRWINEVLTRLHESGHDIIGYGAAAKGMTLLHYLLQKRPSWTLQYVVDDAPLKQNTYCPGTTIPIRPTSHLAKYNGVKPLAIIVLTWNFWAEIRQRIKLSGLTLSEVWIVLPFPEQRVALLTDDPVEATAIRNPYVPAPTLPIPPSPLMLIAHLRQGLTAANFVQHHAPLFDVAVLVDWTDGDASNAAASVMPSTWTVVRPTAGDDPRRIAEQLAADHRAVELNGDELLVMTRSDVSQISNCASIALAKLTVACQRPIRKHLSLLAQYHVLRAKGTASLNIIGAQKGSTTCSVDRGYLAAVAITVDVPSRISDVNYTALTCASEYITDFRHQAWLTSSRAVSLLDFSDKCRTDPGLPGHCA